MVIEPAGFCPGVKRAFELALQTLKEKDKSVYLLGDLVHNRHAVVKLQEEGVQFAENPEEIPPGTTVITRSHGIEQDTIQKLQERRVAIVDTTCPRVKKVRDLAQELEEKGYILLILGNPEHPEIRSLLSFLKNRPLVFKTEEEWSCFDFSPFQGKKIAVLTQTTFPRTLFEAFLRWKNEKWPQVVMEVFHTLCAETETRQTNLTRKIKEEKLTTVIVVGGQKSSNTASLFLLARRENVRTVWVEGWEELTQEMFHPSEKIGIASGASTPDWIVKQVFDWLRNQSCLGEKA